RRKLRRRHRERRRRGAPPSACSARSLPLLLLVATRQATVASSGYASTLRLREGSTHVPESRLFVCSARSSWRGRSATASNRWAASPIASSTPPSSPSRAFSKHLTLQSTERAERLYGSVRVRASRAVQSAPRRH